VKFHRMKLAAKGSGEIFDQLAQSQLDMARGDCGTLKPLSLSTSQLAKVAQSQPTTMDALEGLIGQRHAERFGPAFLDIIAAA